MEIDNKYIYIGIGIIIAILLLFAINLGFAKKASLSGANVSMPEECKVPVGQDVQAWKEHLGHHANTQYCLQYYK